MPMYDRTCTSCGTVVEDSYEPMRASGARTCPEGCGKTLERRITSGTGDAPAKAPGVNADAIPGGIYIRHGLCHADGTPRRFDSKTDIRKAAAKKGLTWGYDSTEHIPARGTDKNPNTAKWT